MRNHRVVLPFCYYPPLIAPYHPNITMLPRFPMTFSPKPSQTSQSIVDTTATTRLRSLTTITMLEEELGACEQPAKGFLPKLRISRPTTQCPKGPWVTFWDSGEDDLPQSPHEDVTGGFPDYYASGEQDSELDQDVTTPTDSAAWSTDEELTPPFSSKFPRTPHPNALTGEGRSDGKSRKSTPQVLLDLTHDMNK